MRQSSTGFVYRDGAVAGLEDNLRPAPSPVLAFQMRVAGIRRSFLQRIGLEFGVDFT